MARVNVEATGRSENLLIEIEGICSWNAPGLAVTPEIGGNQRPLPERWTITHTRSGKSMLPHPGARRDVALKTMKRVGTLVDWTKSVEALNRECAGMKPHPLDLVWETRRQLEREMTRDERNEAEEDEPGSRVLQDSARRPPCP